MRIEVLQNNGIISTGDRSINTLNQDSHGLGAIDWERLEQEIQALKQKPDISVKQFADEATEALQKKEPAKVKLWLSKWIPCIGKLIETSYYILEIAAGFGLT